ncbi:unnamed protein product [Orchesella dallaii]|uniref:Uncharacterized protein n=1 Tax=Orchesella dallaii TaxID=48710 RepID=A0ABP1Q0V5_9HEXA
MDHPLRSGRKLRTVEKVLVLVSFLKIIFIYTPGLMCSIYEGQKEVNSVPGRGTDVAKLGVAVFSFLISLHILAIGVILIRVIYRGNDDKSRSEVKIDKNRFEV